MTVNSVRQAAAVCNVTPPVIRRWLALGLIPGPPCAVQQLHQIRDETDPQGRRRGPQVPHGTLTRWLEGCDCDRCRETQNDAARARFRRKAQERLPVEVRQQLLDAIYGGQPFRTALRQLGVTSNQVWGLAKTDQEWSRNLEAALTATRRNDLQHGTNAAYVRRCICRECREHQRIRMARNRVDQHRAYPDRWASKSGEPLSGLRLAGVSRDFIHRPSPVSGRPKSEPL
jgi:hypothetical protein